MNTDKKPFLDSKLIENASLKLRACNHRFRIAILSALHADGPADLGQLCRQLDLSETYVLEQLDFLRKAGLVIKLPDGAYMLDKDSLAAIDASVRAFADR